MSKVELPLEVPSIKYNFTRFESHHRIVSFMPEAISYFLYAELAGNDTSKRWSNTPTRNVSLRYPSRIQVYVLYIAERKMFCGFSTLSPPPIYIAETNMFCGFSTLPTLHVVQINQNWKLFSMFSIVKNANCCRIYIISILVWVLIASNHGLMF